MDELKAGVAGAGVFGGFHAGKLAGRDDARLVRVLDADLARAQALAAGHGAQGVDDLAAFLDGLDVVVVASPGVTHAAVARAALEAGAHVYVEKPLATSLTDARALVDVAAAMGRVLAVGHQERATFAAMGLFDAGERPARIDSVRRGVPNARNRDISCVLDLMVHDLDLALALSGAEPSLVRAEGGFDAVVAEIAFTDGLVARFEASRVAQARARTMRIEFPSGEVEVDFLAPAFANRSAVALEPGFAAAAPDPLEASLSRFLAAARGQGAPLADGQDGLRALALALQVEGAAGLFHPGAASSGASGSQMEPARG